MENTVASKLEALRNLQSIDIELNEINKMRGALPDEVMDLEDEIAGYQTRINKHNEETEALEKSISDNRNAIKDAEALIAKYKDQQMNVRNNREYDAITKETELQELEIQILEKKIKEAYQKIEDKKGEREETKAILDEKHKDLEGKKQELEIISSESYGEETKLMEKRENAAGQVEDRLLKSYNKIRLNMRNGLAVVPVRRGACGGCFNIVPPQKQVEIREKKKIIVCEHCGRILADVDDDIVEEKKPKRRAKRT